MDPVGKESFSLVIEIVGIIIIPVFTGDLTFICTGYPAIIGIAIINKVTVN